MQVVDEVLAGHALAVVQEVLLPFASHGSKLLAPLFHFPYLALVGESHQADKEVEEQFVLFVQMDGLQCFDEVSVCQVGYRLAVAGLHSVLLLQGFGYVGFFNLGNVEALRAAEDGGQYHFRSFGDEEEYRFLGWLFQQFQQLVGAYFMQLFG